MKRTLLVAVVVLSLAAVVLADAHEGAAEETTEADAQFVEGEAAERPIRTPETKAAALFQARCAACHGSDKPAAGLVLTTDAFKSAVLDVQSVEIKSLELIDTEAPDKSYLLMKLRGDKGIQGGRMPANAPPLEDEEILIVEEWIAFVLAARAAEAAEAEDEDAGATGAAAAGAAAGAAAAGSSTGEGGGGASEQAVPSDDTDGKKKP